MPIRKTGASVRGRYAAREVVSVLSGSAQLVGADRGSKYSSERVDAVRTNEDITNMGAIVEQYDPEWNAWLAGEI